MREYPGSRHRALALLADDHKGIFHHTPYTAQVAFDLLTSDRVDPEPFISGVRPLDDVVEARSVVTCARRLPNLTRVEDYGEYYEVYHSLYPAQRDAMRKLSDLATGHG